ncbi:MAG TPA: pilus assembly protein [Hyphomicrobiaceae bacterium]|nr:pilus assembly protein [Hyphomicrobiaceae bacterium]
MSQRIYGKRVSRLIRRFRREETGGVAIMFALATMVIFGAVGGAIDTSRAYTLKSRMQSAMDAASLAGVSHYLMDPAHSQTDAINQAKSYFEAAMADYPDVDITVTLDPKTNTININATAQVKTPFLAVLGFPSLTVSSGSEATTKSTLTGGGEVEMSLMLDVTGSMGTVLPSGETRLKAMQKAALNFVDILIPDSGTSYAKIALAPFSRAVNAGDYAGLVTGQALTRAGTKGTEFLRRCVTERTGAEALSDAAPGIGTYMPLYIPNKKTAYTTSYSDAADCGPNQSIVPLTASKVPLKNTINAFQATGSTAGPLGTAWAWYLLSPQWSGVFTGTSAPKAYGTSKLRKIAVLLTDGTYNTRGGVNYGDTSLEAIEISQNAVNVCTAMKAKGIEIFTVGFGLDTQLARDTMANCATSPDRAFLADDAAQLEAAFRDIAHRSVPLHLSQ